MKVVQINATGDKGSTGRICIAVADLLTAKGVENYIFYSQGESQDVRTIKFANYFEIKLNALKAKLFGNYGFTSRAITKRLIKKLDKIQPNIIQLHNVHSHDVNLTLLFDYCKKNGVKVVWSFHDCWAFTGYCPHFDLIGCTSYQTDCKVCPQRKEYSKIFNRASKILNLKKQALLGVDLTIVTPSNWLSDKVRNSFLKHSNISQIPYGIDLSVFKPKESDFKNRYGLQDKFVILGVAFGWGYKKGLDVFIKLASELKDVAIVLVGTDEKIDKLLPKNVISIHRTHSKSELAEIYSACDLFVNPTREETFGLVNVESLACGTPVITFNTGGSPEAIDKSCGVVVERDDFLTLKEEILRIKKEMPFSTSSCIQRAHQFSDVDNFAKYVQLYEGLMK